MRFANKLILLTILCLSTIFIIKYLNFSKPFKINEIIVEGNNYIKTQAILGIIDKCTEDKSILDISFNEIKNALYKNDFVDKVKIYRKVPSSIIINILETEPIGLLENNESLVFLTENLGLINANYNSINHFSNTPVITNLNEEKIDLLKTKDILQKIKSNKIYNKLNEVRFENDKIILILNNYTTIILDDKNYKNSLNKFLRFNDDIIIKKNKKIDNYEYINVSIPNQIIINKKNTI